MIANLRCTFGDESCAVPALTAIAISADTDNTDANRVVYLESLRLTPAP